jgi:hypothetical protein
MLNIFFDVKGIFHKEFILKGQTINSVYYFDVLWRLRENVRRLRAELCHQKNWLLHKNNAPSHISVFTRKFVSKNNMTVVHQPHFSSELALCEISLFLRLKIKLKGHHFEEF